MSRVALVTGGAKRIGRAICLELAAQGYDILIHYRDSYAEAKETRLACLAAGAKTVNFIACDLSESRGRAMLISSALSLAGKLDLLVNNASLFAYDSASTFTPGSLEQHLQTNYLAPVELSMALFQQCSQRGQKSHVVTLLDQKIHNLNTDYVSYTLAKLASHSSIRYLAQCCAPVLRVNAVAPGVSLISGKMKEHDFSRAHKMAALGQSNSPGDIAAAILMLDKSPAITGQTLTVDGGQHLLPRGRDVAYQE